VKEQVRWVINDGASTNTPINTTTVTLTAVNDPPAVTNQAAHVPFTVSSTVTLSPSISVSDPDNQTLASATVSITGGTFAGDGDVLSINGSQTGSLGAIAYSYDAGTERLILTGVDTPAD